MYIVVLISLEVYCVNVHVNSVDLAVMKVVTAVTFLQERSKHIILLLHFRHLHTGRQGMYIVDARFITYMNVWLVYIQPFKIIIE